MSFPSDYDDEMGQIGQIDDEMAERFLSGLQADGALAPLAELAEDVRTLRSGPAPLPSPGLAALLAGGLPGVDGDLPVPAASSVTRPGTPVAASPSRSRRRRIVGKLLAGTLAAKAAVVMSVAVAGVTAAGAAGALPAPAQNVVAAAVEAATPFSFPHDKAVDKAVDNADLGERVSTDARNGGPDGAVVHGEAQQQGEVGRPAEPVGSRPPGAGDAPSAGAPGPGTAPAPGSPGTAGLDIANNTPAAGHAPTSVPAGQPAPVRPPPGAGPPPAGDSPVTDGPGPTLPAPAAGRPPEAGSGVPGAGPAQPHSVAPPRPKAP